jgi:hypothetical protein
MKVASSRFLEFPLEILICGHPSSLLLINLVADLCSFLRELSFGLQHSLSDGLKTSLLSRRGVARPARAVRSSAMDQGVYQIGDV